MVDGNSRISVTFDLQLLLLLSQYARYSSLRKLHYTVTCVVMLCRVSRASSDLHGLE